MSLGCKYQAWEMLLFPYQIGCVVLSLEQHTCYEHLQYQSIHTGCHQHWYKPFVNVGNYFTLSHFFLYWKPCKPVGCFLRQILHNFFLDNYVLCVLLIYFHSNHNTTSVLPKICFPLQQPKALH